MEVTLDQLEISKYPAYKDSRVEWLGEIPEQWEVKKLKNISDSFPSNVDKHSKPNEKQVRLCNYTDVYKNEFISNEMNFMIATASEDQIQKFSLKIGDIIITKDSETSSDIAVPALVKEELMNVICGYHLAIIRSHKKVNPNYLFRQFQDKSFNAQFEICSNGITRVGLGSSDLKKGLFLVPPLPEQTAIANFLDQKTALIDQAIQIKEKQIALLKERRQILIHQAVTRGLDPNVKLKDSGVEWIGMIPEHWEVKKITHIFSKIGSGTTPTSGDLRYYGGKTNFLQTGDLNDGYIIETNKTLKDKALKDFSSLKIYPKGSLVMAMYGATIGKLGILQIEAATNQACCVLGDSKEVSPEYMFFLLLAFRKQIISFGYGGGQPNISQDLIKSLRFPIPKSMQEQLKILNKIKAFTDKIDQTIFLKEKEIEKLMEYKLILINCAVTGKIKVAGV